MDLAIIDCICDNKLSFHLNCTVISANSYTIFKELINLPTKWLWVIHIKHLNQTFSKMLEIQHAPHSNLMSTNSSGRPIIPCHLVLVSVQGTKVFFYLNVLQLNFRRMCHQGKRVATRPSTSRIPVIHECLDSPEKSLFRN